MPGTAAGELRAVDFHPWHPADSADAAARPLAGIRVPDPRSLRTQGAVGLVTDEATGAYTPLGCALGSPTRRAGDIAIAFATAAALTAVFAPLTTRLYRSKSRSSSTIASNLAGSGGGMPALGRQPRARAGHGGHPIASDHQRVANHLA